MSSARRPGRPRDPGIDDRVLDTVMSHLAAHGYEAMSLTAVAAEAGTTRQAIYRRWPTKADVATAAIGARAASTAPIPTGDHFADLVENLTSFRRGVSRPDGLSMVGTMLQSAVDPELLRLYRDRVVRPRRQALKRILAAARDDGLLPAGADLDIGVSCLTGSWYGLALTGTAPPAGWEHRIARLVWRGLGGEPPEDGEPG